MIADELRRLGMEPCSISRSAEPLRDVQSLATGCAGGLILGFELRPTPWNHLEAGILYALGLPLLVFREPAVRGGIFDDEVSGGWSHPMPVPGCNGQALRRAIGEWEEKVWVRAGRVRARPAAEGGY